MENDNYNGDLARLIHDGDKRSYNGRLERLKFLLSIESQNEYPASALAHEYFEEARLCWYVGAFVSTIVMVQLSLEELLRSHYRVAKGIGGKLSSGKEVNNAGFCELINEAENDRYISRQEAESLHGMRKNIRNPFVHIKDIEVNANAKRTFRKPNFFTQTLKILAPEVLKSDVANEAKGAIQLLVTLFPEISSRYGGL
jgi:hypothetical protein